MLNFFYDFTLFVFTTSVLWWFIGLFVPAVYDLFIRSYDKMRFIRGSQNGTQQ